MVNLNGAHLMDGQHVLSQEHLNVASDIAHRYENLRLVWIPPVDRIPGTDDEPFAIKDIRSGIIIKRFPEKYVVLIPRWLYENDSQRVDTLKLFMAAEAKHKKDQEAAIHEAQAPAVELTHSILKSKLHTFVHDGVRYGDSGIEKMK